MRVSRQQAAENRKRVLEVAGTLFREKGFDGIGVAELMKAAGLTHGGFYGQFASKDELAAEALAGAMDEAVARWKARAAKAPDDPYGAIVRRYLSAEHRDGMAAGCAISALGGDVMRQTPAVRSRYTEGLGRLIDVLMSALDGDAAARRTQALATLASLTGALTLARAVDDPALSDEILAASLNALGISETKAAGVSLPVHGERCPAGQ